MECEYENEIWGSNTAVIQPMLVFDQPCGNPFICMYMYMYDMHDPLLVMTALP
jgi:hypothetical protein